MCNVTYYIGRHDRWLQASRAETAVRARRPRPGPGGHAGQDRERPRRPGPRAQARGHGPARLAAPSPEGRAGRAVGGDGAGELADRVPVRRGRCRRRGPDRLPLGERHDEEPAPPRPDRPGGVPRAAGAERHRGGEGARRLAGRPVRDRQRAARHLARDGDPPVQGVRQQCGGLGRAPVRSRHGPGDGEGGSDRCAAADAGLRAVWQADCLRRNGGETVGAGSLTPKLITLPGAQSLATS